MQVEVTEEHEKEAPRIVAKWQKIAMRTVPMSADERGQCEASLRALYKMCSVPEPLAVGFVDSPQQLRVVTAILMAHFEKSGETPSNLTASKMNKLLAKAKERCRPGNVALFESEVYERLPVPVDLTQEENARIYNADMMWHGGNQWAARPVAMEFFRDVVGVKTDWSAWNEWETLAIHSGPRVVHPQFALIADFPEVMKLDDQLRPHCTTGPMLKWRDGSAWYMVHNVRVPVWVIEEPQRITPAAIEAQENTEVRRVMLDKYGLDKYVKDSNLDLVSSDDYGKLFRKERPNDEAMQVVHVVNSTPEPDGTFKDYWLIVPPSVRTARQAVAWTFGMKAEEYDPMAQS